MTMHKAVTLGLTLLVALAACAEAPGTTEQARNPTQDCETREFSRLTDTVGATGHASAEKAAEASASKDPDVGAGWYVYKREGAKALLAPTSGPWRLEANEVAEADGWVITGTLTCVEPSPGPT